MKTIELVKRIKAKQQRDLLYFNVIAENFSLNYKNFYDSKIEICNSMREILANEKIEVLKDKSIRRRGGYFDTIRPNLDGYYLLKSAKRTKYLCDYYCTKDFNLHEKYKVLEREIEKHEFLLNELSKLYIKMKDTILNSLDYYLIEFKTETQGFLILPEAEIYARKIDINKLANTLGVNPNDVANVNLKYKTYIFVNVEGVDVELYHPDLSHNYMSLSIDFDVNHKSFAQEWGNGGLKIGANTYYC